MESDAEKPPKRNNKKIFGIAMFLLGAIFVVAIRFALIKDTSVHHHANFAVYINGQKDEFKSFTFYEEVQACSINDPNNVKTRVHMHDQNNSLIHVHASGVTWGQFFNNLNYTLGDEVITTNQGTFVNNQDGNRLTFILNGEELQNVSNKIIKSEDKLLINYGKDEEKVIQDRYSLVPSDAAVANTKPDPAACSGTEELTFWNRLKQSIGLSGPGH